MFVVHLTLLNTVFTAQDVEMDQEPGAAKHIDNDSQKEPVLPGAGASVLPPVVVSSDDSDLPKDKQSVAENVAAELLGGDDIMPALPDFDFDYSEKNPRKTMRLSAEIEAADLRAFTPGAGGYIRFFLADVPDVEIGKLPFGKLVKSSRIGISDAVIIPDASFKIAYDFRDKDGGIIGAYYWICNSVNNTDGAINPFGVYESELDGGEKIKIRNKISAIRLKAFKGGQSKEDAPIRMGFVAPRYSEGGPLKKAVEVPKLAALGTMFNDGALIAEAMKKYPGSAKVVGAGGGAAVEEGFNVYCAIELSDNSVAIAGEYCMRAQEKYGRKVKKDDASQLIALLRNYGIVTRATSEELADYLGLT
ncbi:MAG: hypothetical protein NT128_07450 [Proteobacteria bacterium]|nr:hypothetical protein [Pseudomonadota bacterium]